ncbi:MAG TPA: hypothetical protein PLR39_11380 [Treponemataceae bacterium]|nr:hypothetical protein [Treponemataceae bacterium]
MKDLKISNLNIWRSLAIAGFILMIITQFLRFNTLSNMDNMFFKNEQELFSPFTVFCTNFVSTFAFLYLIFKPLEFRIYFVFSFFYTTSTIIEGGDYTSFFFFIFTMLCAYRSGFLIKNMKRKVTASLILFFLLFVTQIRFGFDVFFESIIKIFALLLLLTVIALMLSEEIKKFIQSNQPSRLVLREYPDLLERDKVFLKAVFAGEKFDYIASSNSMAPGTLRNRMREVYKIIGVADKTELLIRYSGCTE